MSHDQANHGPVSQTGSPPRSGAAPAEGASHALKGPHFDRPAPRVLVRVPDLESAESRVVGEGSPAESEKRLLSSQWSMRVLMVGGALLLVAAVALPFLLGGADEADSSAGESSALPADVPGGLDSVLPEWEGERPSWEVPPGVAGDPQGRTPVLSAWSEDSPPPDWSTSAAMEPQGEAAGQHAAGLGPDVETMPPEYPQAAWSGEGHAVSSGGEPRPSAPGDDRLPWQDRPDVAGLAPPAENGLWSAQPCPAPGVYREAGSAWREDAAPPEWAAPQYRVAEQPQTGTTVWDGGNGSASPADPASSSFPAAAPNRPMGMSPAAQPAYGAQPPADSSLRPRAGTNRSMEISPYRANPADDLPTRRPAASHDSAPRHSAFQRPTVGDAAGFGAGPLGSAPNRPDDSSAPAGPSYRQPSIERSPKTNPAPRYDAGRDRGASEPGVARFLGGIQKPTGTEIHE